MTTATVLTVPKPPQGKWAVWGDRATRLLEYAAAVGIGIMFVTILANVFTRTFFGSPIQGTNEFVGNIWLPAVVFIGYVVAQARGQHVEADILFGRFPRQIRREVRFFTSALSAVAGGIFAFYGYEEAAHAMKIGKTAPASDIYIAPVYWFVPAAFAILAVLFLIDAINSIRGKFDDLTNDEFKDLLAETGGSENELIVETEGKRNV